MVCRRRGKKISLSLLLGPYVRRCSGLNRYGKRRDLLVCLSFFNILVVIIGYLSKLLAAFWLLLGITFGRCPLSK